MSLLPGLKDLGVTDALDGAVSDYSPMTKDREDIYLSSAQHAARVKIDEEGCEAAAYTVFGYTASVMPEQPEEEINFILDRPFLFAITGADNLPLFTGVVNQPEK